MHLEEKIAFGWDQKVDNMRYTLKKETLSISIIGKLQLLLTQSLLRRSPQTAPAPRLRKLPHSPIIMALPFNFKLIATSGYLLTLILKKNLELHSTTSKLWHS